MSAKDGKDRLIDATIEAIVKLTLWFAHAGIWWGCWNTLFPRWEPSVPAITYWQAFALVGLIRMLIAQKGHA